MMWAASEVARETTSLKGISVFFPSFVGRNPYPQQECDSKLNAFIRAAGQDSVTAVGIIL